MILLRLSRIRAYKVDTSYSKKEVSLWKYNRHNKEFPDELKLFDRYFLELFKNASINFQTLLRFWITVPLIVNYLIDENRSEGAFELNDGNHHFEAYFCLGIKGYYVLFGSQKSEYNYLYQSFTLSYLKQWIDISFCNA